MTITIGVDGRMYWHDLTPEMLEVASVVCRDDDALGRRRTAAAKQPTTEPIGHESIG